MPEVSGFFIVKEVRYRSDKDDDALSDDESTAEGKEKDRRARKVADGWFDDENVLRSNVPIHHSIASRLPVYSFAGNADAMPRCGYVSDEKKGARLISVNWGEPQPHTFTFPPGEFSNSDEEDYRVRPWDDDKALVLTMVVDTPSNASSAQIDLKKFSAAHAALGTVGSVSWSGNSGDSGIIAAVFKHKQKMAPSVVAAGGITRAVELTVRYVILGA